MVDQRFFRPIEPTDLGALLHEVGAGDLSGQIGLSILVHGMNELENAGQHEISLAASKQYRDKLTATQAGVVIVSDQLRPNVPNGCQEIVAENAHGLFVALLKHFYPMSGHRLANRVADDDIHRAQLEDQVVVGAGAVIGEGAEIGSGSIIGPNSIIGPGVAIGRNSEIGAGASIECALIGDGVTIHSGARIGTAGFGWLDHGKSNVAIPQLGRVIIQNDVEIGANTTIDRGALGDTVIGENTKIDNLVQIGHNCQIGRNCLIAAMSGLSGATIVGDGVLMGGGVGTSGHLSIGDGCVVSGRSAVTKDWPANSKIAGLPAQEAREFWRGLAVIRRMSRGDKNEH